MHSALAFGLLLPGASAIAEFSVDELQIAAKTAIEDFSKGNPDHVQHLTGYKVWKSGDDAKVKIYVSHDGMDMDFNYLCMKHAATTVCHAE
jgi:hypothetical protein